ncbi:MAG: anthranilate synthase component I [Deltaproteobacteria bacterium]|nr:anthranilate synthase component I [Deltaproteobacteria bacterium]
MSQHNHFPDLAVFQDLKGRAGLVPVYRKIIADLDTPLTLFAKVAENQSHVFLFESMEGGEKWGRYSFIGFDPLVTFSSKGNQIETCIIRGSQKETVRYAGDPLKALKQLVEGFAAAEVGGDLPRFCGGAVGFLGYDMVRFMEDLPDEKPPLVFPDSSFMVPKMVLVHDSFQQTVTVVCWAQLSGIEDAASAYHDAVRRIDEVIARLQAPVSATCMASNIQGCASSHQFSSNMEPPQFKAMVARAQEYIKAGDIIQVVLSQRFHTRTELAPLTLYRALRHINPSPYLFFLKLGDLVQIGSSPEILVRKDGENVELRPIAGTRKRGATPEEDEALRLELLADPKERAEHLMLVDLGRNDVGRVARDGSVEVKDLLVVEKYSHVMHLVSGVHGLIAEGKDQFDVMDACFPAGTVSGAPKIRAMEIIEELEPERRGPYAGAVGYFGFSGNMDFCITIRTFVMQGQDLWIQAGAGIVYDSDPASEYEETINKSMGLRRAVELAEKGF